MKTIYVMLSIIGWAWFVIVFAFLLIRMQVRRRAPQASEGFEVVQRNEKQS